MRRPKEQPTVRAQDDSEPGSDQQLVDEGDIKKNNLLASTVVEARYDLTWSKEMKAPLPPVFDSQVATTPQDGGRKGKRFSIFSRLGANRGARYRKVFSMEAAMIEKKTIFIAKFKPEATDQIAVALLCASDFYAAFMILGCRCVPIVILSLLLVVVTTQTELPGIELLRSASSLEIAVVVLSVGTFVLINLLGPLSRPFATIPKILRIRSRIPDDCADTRQRLLVAGLCLLIKHLTAIFVIFTSPLISLLSAQRIVNLVWATLALYWIVSLEDILVHEVVYRFYRQSTVTLAMTDLKWCDFDTKKQYWRKSWTSKSEIRAGLEDLECDSLLKWTLLTNANRGLGLGSDEDGVPESLSMELLLIPWGSLTETGIKELGPIAAKSICKSEWVYHMSRKQRHYFFKYYPITASQMPWGGTIALDTGHWEDSHLAACARIIEFSANKIEELFIDNNCITDDGAVLLSEALKHNHTIKKLWMYDNLIGNTGAKAIASMLRINRVLKQVMLRGNQIGDKAAKEFASALKLNSSLVALGLNNNNVSNIGALELIEALKTNQSIGRLWLQNNNFLPREMEERLKAASNENNELLTRVVINTNVLSPVTKHMVRTKLEELRLEPTEKRAAREHLRNWGAAVRKRMAKMPSGVCVDSQIEIDMDTTEVKAIVDDITLRLARKDSKKCSR
uniref:Uncharacterized protein n=1 Tax=Lotharella oceanica TaxID=641309 RepID=A0A7S2X6J7_9EUKA|mmetsp:Transcript_12723/g.24328  ORF Transcript_12723/g.24328 Transcript_12723/m.24328 type:complete len:680 (+) Transcript_12723:96-2135(+)